MKSLSTLVMLTIGLFTTSMAQETIQKVMENRAREMHRVIGLSEKEHWKAFIKGNYTQALIDKPMRAVTKTSNNGSLNTSTSPSGANDNLEAKASMFQRLHDDFGNSKIISITPGEEKLEMVVKSNDGLSGTFTLKFDKNKPYLIDGLGVEVKDAGQ